MAFAALTSGIPPLGTGFHIYIGVSAHNQNIHSLSVCLSVCLSVKLLLTKMQLGYVHLRVEVQELGYKQFLQQRITL